MTDAAVEPSGVALRTSDGRIPGRRGRATRRRLLDETRALLDEMAYRDVRVIEISRRAGTSPATFYQYFADVESAVLVLAAEVSDRGARELRRLVDEPSWDAAAASALAAGFLEFFERERSLLRVVDLAALEGDERFRKLRTRMLNGVFLALCDVVQESRSAAAAHPEAAPGAVAGVLTSMLAHVSAHRPGLESWGVPTDDLVTTMGSIIDWSVGRGGPDWD